MKNVGGRALSTGLFFGAFFLFLTTPGPSFAGADSFMTFMKTEYMDDNASPTAEQQPPGVNDSQKKLRDWPTQKYLADTFSIPKNRARLIVKSPRIKFAAVSVNGIPMGWTPIALDLPKKFSDVFVTVKKDGFEKTLEVVLTQGKETKLVVETER